MKKRPNYHSGQLLQSQRSSTSPVPPVPLLPFQADKRAGRERSERFARPPLFPRDRGTISSSCTRRALYLGDSSPSSSLPCPCPGSFSPFSSFSGSLGLDHLQIPGMWHGASGSPAPRALLGAHRDVGAIRQKGRRVLLGLGFNESIFPGTRG